MMSSVAKEWAVVIVFLLAVPIAALLEAGWVSRNASFSMIRSLLFSFSTDLVATVFGFFVTFIIFGVILAMAWDGSLQNVPARDVSIWVAIVLALAFPLVLLIIAKRLGRAAFHLPLNRPWIFSIIASVLFYFTVLGLPALTILAL
jgi:hypothetical protein